MPYNVRTWIFVETCLLNVSINKGKSSELCVTYVLVANLDLCTSSDKKNSHRVGSCCKLLDGVQFTLFANEVPDRRVGRTCPR